MLRRSRVKSRTISVAMTPESNDCANSGKQS